MNEKKNEELDLRVEKLAFGGQGISRFNEYVIFIDRVLPGDLVRAKIYHRKKKLCPGPRPAAD